MSTSTLFQPLTLAGRELPNRIVMAPMTRARSSQPGDIPNPLMAEYYAQRASAGLDEIAAAGQAATIQVDLAILELNAVGINISGLWLIAEGKRCGSAARHIARVAGCAFDIQLKTRYSAARIDADCLVDVNPEFQIAACAINSLIRK